jgi:3-oxoacyl-[acyl-carrier protein] reductase
MDLGLRGKYALVTGGSHGIGRAIALQLADEGSHVAICARTEPRVSETAAALKAKGVQSLGLTADALIPADIERVMRAMIEAWGTLHILVNNVGGGGRWGSPRVEETADDVWLDVFSKNAMAAVRFTRLALPHMRRQRWGRVVTISSLAGREGGARAW